MIQELLQYQDIDKKLRKLEQEVYNSEERKKAQAAKNFLLESEETVSKIDMKAADLLNMYNKVKTVYNDRLSVIAEYEKTVSTLTSGDELSYLTKKVNALSDDIRALEREISNISRDMEEVSKSFVAFRNKHNAARKNYVENKQKFDEIKKEKAEAFAAVKKTLEELAKKIEVKSVLEKYNKKRNDKIFPVLVPCRDNMCGGCSMQIPLNEVDRLKQNKVIECEHCRRLIYVEE